MHALDTNRIARIGTVMHVTSIEKQYSYNGKSLDRILVTCQPVGLVEILNVSLSMNESDELIDDDEEESYLLASVKEYLPKERLDQWEGDVSNPRSDKLKGMLKHLWKSYSMVKAMYVTDPKKRTATRELPPFAVDAVQNALLSKWMTYDDTDKIRINHDDEYENDKQTFFSTSRGANTKEEEEFWKLAESWQALCNTLRQGHLSNFYSDRNEIMIDAARREQKGKPLRLPVKKEHLSKEVQMLLTLMEQRAIENFISLGMDPCLDFQALISLNCWEDRIEWLTFMVERERKRLEMKAKLLN